MTKEVPIKTGKQMAEDQKKKEDAAGDARMRENAEEVQHMINGEKTASIPAERMAAPIVSKVTEIVPQNEAMTVLEPRPQFNESQIALIRNKFAPNCTPTEFELLLYVADKYKLDPLVRQIWAVKYKDAPAAILCGRDGFLEIAHRSGHFNGMESGTREENGEIIGWCKVWRMDMEHAFYIEVYLKEYQKPVPFSGKPGLWQTMPRVMIQKVAES